ncbi:MAG: MBL fold metallo-hydrolase [Actinomycetota bacterium]
MELSEVGDGVLLAQRSPGGFGASNSVAIYEEDGITVVDAGTVPAHAAEFADMLADTGVPIRRLVYTSPHIDHVGGSSAYPLAAVYGRPETSALLDQPPNIAAYTHLEPSLGADFAELTTRPVSHTVNEAAWLSGRVVAAPTHGQTTENLVVQVPDCNVVIAGAMAAFGAIPAAWAGDPAAWADQLEVILGWGSTVVPAYGPAGGEAEVRQLQGYLRSLEHGGPGEGAWTTWTNQRFHAANVERAQRLANGDPSPGPTLLALMGIS